MKRTTRMKRLAIDALCAGLIAVLMCAPVFAGTQPDGFVTDDNGFMAYHVPRASYAEEHGYDFMGCVDGQWRQITYKTDGSSGSDYGYSGFKAGAYHKESASSLNVTTATPQFIENGKAIQMEYTVTNTSEDTAITGYRFYIAADTKVAGNEKSTNTVNGSTVTMTSDGISFFALSKTDGCTIVPTQFNDAYKNIRSGATDPSTVTRVADPSDSALVMYYGAETLNAGESKTYTLVVGMGKSSEVPDIIDDITGDDTDTTPAEKSPATGDNDSLALWLALLFVSGGAVAGTTIASKKRNLDR
jgi:hypothetical protein